MSKKLDSLNEEYMSLHYQILDLLRDREDNELNTIEGKLANHENKFSSLTMDVVRLSREIAAAKPFSESEQKVWNTKLGRIR